MKKLNSLDPGISSPSAHQLGSSEFKHSTCRPVAHKPRSCFAVDVPYREIYAPRRQAGAPGQHFTKLLQQFQYIPMNDVGHLTGQGTMCKPENTSLLVNIGLAFFAEVAIEMKSIWNKSQRNTINTRPSRKFQSQRTADFISKQPELVSVLDAEYIDDMLEILRDHIT